MQTPSFSAEAVRVYVGTYTRGESQGIYTFTIDARDGTPSDPVLAAELVNPSFVAIHPSREYLYAVNEVSQFPQQAGSRGVGGVTGFAIDPESGALHQINSQVSGGAGPCHLCVDDSGRNVLVANYGGGSIACLPIGEDGALKPASTFIQHSGSSINPRRQEGPHAHSINLDHANKFAVVADLGLDELLVYQFDAETGTLKPNDPPSVATHPGAGPRHFSFHPSGQFAYNNNELQSSLTAYAFDSQTGVLTPLMTQTTLPVKWEGDNNSTAEALVHPSGKFVYVSNRGHNSIAIFAIQQDGTIDPRGHASTQGEIPRNFGIDPSGRYLLAANQNSDSVVVFRINAETGQLSPTGDVVQVPTPVCVRFLDLD